MRLVDLSADYNGYHYDLHIDPDKVAAVTDSSGTYWDSCEIILIGGGVVTARLTGAEVRRRLEEEK
jgi:hypothetical protein